MRQNGLDSQCNALHQTPNDIKGRSFHLLSAYWVPSKRVLGAFTPITSLNPSRTVRGRYYYPPLYRWENWGAERKGDVFTTAHFVSRAWFPKSTHNPLPFKTSSWHMIDHQSPLRTVIKINPIFSMPLWVEPQIKAECQNSNYCKLKSRCWTGTWGQRCPLAHRELSELPNPGGFKCPGVTWE